MPVTTRLRSVGVVGLAAPVACGALVLACAGATLTAAPAVDLAGQWTLNRDLSQFPDEVGFGVEPTAPATATRTGGSSGGGGGRGGGGRGGGGRGAGGSQAAGGSYAAMPVMLSEDDAKKIAELIDDARAPSSTLTITQTEAAVTIVDAHDLTRRFHPNGKEDTEQLASGPVGATSKWNGRQLVVDVNIAKDRMFRYVYSKQADGKLLVETRLEDKPGHDAGNIITRVYDSK